MFGSKKKIEELEATIAELRAELLSVVQFAIDEHEHPHAEEIVALEDVVTQLRIEVDVLTTQFHALSKRVDSHEHPHSHPAIDLPPQPKPEKEGEYETNTMINDIPVKIFPRRKKTKTT